MYRSYYYGHWSLFACFIMMYDCSSLLLAFLCVCCSCLVSAYETTIQEIQANAKVSTPYQCV